MNIVECRTKEEILEYFKKVGKEISEEKLNALKQSFKQAEEKTEALTLQQLNKVAGGASRFIEFFRSSRRTGDKSIELSSFACIGDQSSSSCASFWERFKPFFDTNHSPEKPDKHINTSHISQSQAQAILSQTGVPVASGQPSRTSSLPAMRSLDEILGVGFIGLFVTSSLLVTVADIVDSSNKDSSKS